MRHEPLEDGADQQSVKRKKGSGEQTECRLEKHQETGRNPVPLFSRANTTKAVTRIQEVQQKCQRMHTRKERNRDVKRECTKSW